MTNPTPLTDQQLAEIQTLDLLALMDDRAAAKISGHLAALLAEVSRLRAAMEEIQRLHTDSPMGPCPVCIDADKVAAGGDGLVPYPCPTGRLAGNQDCAPPHVRVARAEQAGRQPESTDRVVAYRSPHWMYLYCTRHTDDLGTTWTPLTSDDLPNGGLCAKCGADVLIPQEADRG